MVQSVKPMPSSIDAGPAPYRGVNSFLLLCRRGFVQWVYEPIKTLIECCMADNREQLWKLTDRLGVTPKLKACVPAYVEASHHVIVALYIRRL